MMLHHTYAYRPFMTAALPCRSPKHVRRDVFTGLTARRAISMNILDFPARVLVISGGKRPQTGSDSGPETRFCPLLERPAVPSSSGSRLQTHNPVGVRGQTGGQHWVVRRLLRLTGTSRRPPIGWAQPVPAAPRRRVTSGLPARRLRCQSTSRPASVPETPNAEARGCVRRRRTSRVDAPW
jgi:hypothetical protein